MGSQLFESSAVLITGLPSTASVPLSELHILTFWSDLSLWADYYECCWIFWSSKRRLTEVPLKKQKYKKTDKGTRIDNIMSVYFQSSYWMLFSNLTQLLYDGNYLPCIWKVLNVQSYCWTLFKFALKATRHIKNAFATALDLALMHPEYNFSLVFSTVCPMKLITKPKALGFSAVIVCSRLGYKKNLGTSDWWSHLLISFNKRSSPQCILAWPDSTIKMLKYFVQHGIINDIITFFSLAVTLHKSSPLT